MDWTGERWESSIQGIDVSVQINARARLDCRLLCLDFLVSARRTDVTGESEGLSCSPQTPTRETPLEPSLCDGQGIQAVGSDLGWDCR